MTEEQAIVGWKKIAGMFHADTQHFTKKHKEELVDCGVVFFQKMNRGGRTAQICACAFPSQLMRWAGFKAKKGEVI